MILPVQQSTPNFGFGPSGAPASLPESEAPELIRPTRSSDASTPESDADSKAAEPVANAKREAEKSSLSNEDLNEAARELTEKIRQLIKPSGRDLEFDVDEENHSVVISVIDRETREVIRTIPNQDFVSRVAAEFLESGHLFSSTA